MLRLIPKRQMCDRQTSTAKFSRQTVWYEQILNEKETELVV